MMVLFVNRLWVKTIDWKIKSKPKRASLTLLHCLRSIAFLVNISTIKEFRLSIYIINYTYTYLIKNSLHFYSWLIWNKKPSFIRWIKHFYCAIKLRKLYRTCCSVHIAVVHYVLLYCHEHKINNIFLPLETINNFNFKFRSSFSLCRRLQKTCIIL